MKNGNKNFLMKKINLKKCLKRKLFATIFIHIFVCLKTKSKKSQMKNGNKKFCIMKIIKKKKCKKM